MHVFFQGKYCIISDWLSHDTQNEITSFWLVRQTSSQIIIQKWASFWRLHFRSIQRWNLPHAGNCRTLQMSAGRHVSPIRQSWPCWRNHLPALFLILVDTLNIQLVYLANLATMILINLPYRRFDNLLQTISEILTRGICFGNPRAREANKAG